MSKQLIKIKVLKGAPELVNKVLNLAETEEGVYYCNKNKIQIIDSWGELSIMDEKNKTSVDSIFYDMHLFSDSFGKELKFIDEVEYIK